MKKLITLIIILTMTFTLAAQNYSPCYTNNMSKGNTAFSQGKYSEAKTYYATAKQCAGGNPTEAQKKIAACDTKIKAQKEAAAEAKQKAEAEARQRAAEEAAAKKKAEEEAKERQKQEELRQAEIAEKNDAQRLASLACPSQSTVTDYDGNRYRTVQIGKQCWMAENLRTTHYANGTSIPMGSVGSETTAYRYYPNNNNNTVQKYGYLYNWTAATHGAASSNRNPSGVQGICPNGWHLPSNAEWNQLIDYVRSQNKFVCEGKSTNIAKSLACKTGWDWWPSNSCSPGYYPSDNNATGFSASPSGQYMNIGERLDQSFTTYGGAVNYWSATADPTDSKSAYQFTLSVFFGDPIDMGKSSYTKGNGYSIRCVKN